MGNGGLKPETLAKRKRYYDEVSQLQLPKFSVFSCLSKVFVCTSKPLPSLPSSFWRKQRNLWLSFWSLRRGRRFSVRRCPGMFSMLFSSWTLSSRSVNCDFFSFLSHAALSNCESHFTKISSRFFFQIRVKDKKGNLLAPKKNTMAGYKSGIKMEIIERHQLDIFDTCVFPSHDKLWRSVDKMLVKVGRSTTTHHEEVRPETMMKIYELLALLVKVLKAGGTPVL